MKANTNKKERKAHQQLLIERRELNKLEKELALISSGLSSPHATLIAKAARQVGALEAQIEEFDNLKQQYKELLDIESRLEETEKAANRLRRVIESIELKLTVRRSKVYTETSANTIEIIEQDLKAYNDFENLKSFSFSFRDDTFILNDMEKITKSASSMAIAKASFLLALFKTSLEDSEMYLPRFMVLDNIEDKGVIPERSQNFQNIIAAICDKAEVDNQIIVTTANISPLLDNEKYTVGELYSKTNRSLKI